MKIANIKNKSFAKWVKLISSAIEQDKNIFRYLRNLRESMCPEGEALMNEVRVKYNIDRFVHLSTKGSHESNNQIDNTEFDDTTGKMTMFLSSGRTVKRKLSNFTQYARTLISTALKEDEVMIQIVLMMDHAEEILFSECVNEIS